MRCDEVSVAEQGHEGVAIGPIPGSTPSTEVYVADNGGVYQFGGRSTKGVKSEGDWISN